MHLKKICVIFKLLEFELSKKLLDGNTLYVTLSHTNTTPSKKRSTFTIKHTNAEHTPAQPLHVLFLQLAPLHTLVSESFKHVHSAWSCHTAGCTHLEYDPSAEHPGGDNGLPIGAGLIYSTPLMRAGQEHCYNKDQVCVCVCSLLYDLKVS